MGLHGNYIDLLILIIVLIYLLKGIKRGFWPLIGDLISFFGSLFIAFRLYPLASQFLISNFSLPYSFANAIGFMVIAFLSQSLLGMLVWRALSRLPRAWGHAPWTRIAAVLPALVDSLVLISIGLTLFVSLPVSPKIKSDIENSKIGAYLVARTENVEGGLVDIFGGAIRDTLNFVTIKPESGEKIDLPYKPEKLTIDEESEQKMLEMVNHERAAVGVKPLRMDQTIVKVARAHSFDMWERGYFAHENPDGKSPFDRMKEGGVKFTTAGENIALAPTLDTAHKGLMNSPGHKRNILDPEFGRVGIGIVDGGFYGLMVTQDFAN